MSRFFRTIITQPAALRDLEKAYGGSERADNAFRGPSFILCREPEAGLKTYHNSKTYCLGLLPKGLWQGGFVYYSFDDTHVTIHKFVFTKK